MQTIETLLQDVPLFQSLQPADLALIAGCGSNVQFRAGELIVRDGDTADVFYVLRHGSVALETFVPARGAVTIETLEPGDVIATGTPEGVGFARTPPEFLKDGDVMEVEIEKIGVLRNRVSIS